MRKLFLILATFFFLAHTPAYAADDKFDISSDSTLTVQDTGKTTVAQRITISNNTEYYYTPSYGMTYSYKNIDAISVYTATGGSLPYTVSDTDEGKKIEINFPYKNVGLNQRNAFTIQFTTDEIAKKSGSIWEITVPGVKNIDDFADYSVHVAVPQKLGKPSIIKPRENYTYQGNTLTFEKKSIGESGIFVVFGDQQYYGFNLDYHIQNTNLFPIKTEVALPPSTGYQDVLINSIDPAPQDVYQDADGNWLAQYSLSPQQKQTIHVKGVTRLNLSPHAQSLTGDARKKYTAAQPYWETSSSEVQKAAAGLKNARDIYNYVVKTLSYDYSKVSENTSRNGARKSLLKPDNSVCLEFTDLFVALARAKGIPARAVEGYAYTENDKLRPLSLVKDVLHAWPEYYDDAKQAWIAVDPTWGNTTGGTDYFDVLDFDHVAFVIKGSDSEYPVPAGGYKFAEDSQDVHMSFVKNTDYQPKSFIDMETSIPKTALSAFPIQGNVTVQNTGNIPLYNKTVKVTTPLNSRQNEYQISALPPYGKSVLLLDFDKTPLLTNKVYPVTIQFEGFTNTKQIEVSVLPHSEVFIIGAAAGVTIIILLIIAGFARRLYLQKRAE
jgi:hypothetical protein